MKRREFLLQSSRAAAVLAFPLLVPRHVLGATKRTLGPNDRLQVGFIGLGGRARWILKNEALPGAELIAVADCNLARCTEGAQQIPGGERWKKYQDHRDLLEKEKL